MLAIQNLRNLALSTFSSSAVVGMNGGMDVSRGGGDGDASFREGFLADADCASPGPLVGKVDASTTASDSSDESEELEESSDDDDSDSSTATGGRTAAFFVIISASESELDDDELDSEDE